MNRRIGLITSEDTPRLIEHAFPLKQASLDSVHEKNVRHGHISTLHIWPARRPLAACRAALIATLLPDPGLPEKRKELVERIGGKVVTIKRKKKLPNGKIKIEYKDETDGGVLHWGRESNPDMDWFREEIRSAFNGRNPRVLDPFAGGGAIPLEAMRLGCDVTAIDLNPVAWFILRCTLEHSQILMDKKWMLPQFALESSEFMREFWKKTGKYSKKQLDARITELETGHGKVKQTGLMNYSRVFAPEATVAWHVRAWGHWVLERARKDLGEQYPIIDGKPAIAYLWARTVKCKNCRATIPLLKTLWLCKKKKKRILLKIIPNENKKVVIFDIQDNVPIIGENTAQRREHDKRIGQGTMSRSGAWCPCCGQLGTVAMDMSDIQNEGINGNLGTQLYVVVINTENGKKYRLPTNRDIIATEVTDEELMMAYVELPNGMPNQRIEPTSTRSISCHTYGLNTYTKLFTRRQLLANAVFIKYTRLVQKAMENEGYPIEWRDGVVAYLTCVFDKYLDYANSLASWYTQNEQITHLFNRFALPIKWDFAETSPIGGASGSYESMLNSVVKSVIGTTATLTPHVDSVKILCENAMRIPSQEMDLIITDPPYYEAVSYADLSDFFYVWLRIIWGDRSPILSDDLTNKTEEIVQHIGEGNDRAMEKEKYESRMGQVFIKFAQHLNDEGRLAIVFAHKNPDAWETLVSAIIRAGFVVKSSWPIQTEMPNRSRGYGMSALSSSVWLVCSKRSESARPGWDNQVLKEMHSNIHNRLREFWDAGIRGPDFVWAATGPALEAYSKHPIVKKANEPGQVMTVSEFLRHVRRIVVDFVVGRVLSHNGDDSSATGLDDVTTYYLLHRHDFGFDDAPAGASILYAVSCGLSDTTLADDFDILIRTGGATTEMTEPDEDSSGEDDVEPEVEEGTGSTVRLKTWKQRSRKTLGYTTKDKPSPLIDRAHRLMHLWRAGDVSKVDEYIEEQVLVQNTIFHQVLQALIELAKEGTEERSILESLSNHLSAKGGTIKKIKSILDYRDKSRAG